jgi:ABC-2 type transport system ATP-binding protein
MAMIVAEGLTKDYKLYQRGEGLWGSVATLFSRRYSTMRAVDAVSFSIEAGAKVAYIGPNGAGKSSTIKILTGIMAPTSGRCEVAGVVPYLERVRNAANIGVVFGQRTQLWWDLPVIDSFAILRRIYEIPDAVFDKNMRLFRALLAIDEVAQVPVRKLSLGQRMRIEIAASFLHDPKVVFLDEPTIGLDAILKQAIRALIKRMNEEVGTTVVLTSHDMDDIKEICDDVIVIDQGRVVYQGALAALNAMEQRRSVLVDFRATPASAAALAQMARELPGIDQLEHEAGGRMRIHFQRERLDLQSLMAYLFARFEVLELYALEPDLESIIRQIYLHGVPARQAA